MDGDSFVSTKHSPQVANMSPGNFAGQNNYFGEPPIIPNSRFPPNSFGINGTEDGVGTQVGLVFCTVQVLS